MFRGPGVRFSEWGGSSNRQGVSSGRFGRVRLDERRVFPQPVPRAPQHSPKTSRHHLLRPIFHPECRQWPPVRRQ